MKSIKYLVLGFFTACTLIAVSANIVYAQSKTPTSNQVDLGTQYAFGGSKFQTIGQLISRILPIVFAVSGIVVIFWFLYAAIKYLTAGANKEEVAKARSMIANSLVGFLLLMLVFIIAQFIMAYFGAGSLRILQ